jgi:hypothetical protein
MTAAAAAAAAALHPKRLQLLLTTLLLAAAATQRLLLNSSNSNMWQNLEPAKSASGCELNLQVCLVIGSQFVIPLLSTSPGATCTSQHAYYYWLLTTSHATVHIDAKLSIMHDVSCAPSMHC